VVVLDMVMPGQDGIATLQEIKQRKQQFPDLLTRHSGPTIRP